MKFKKGDIGVRIGGNGFEPMINIGDIAIALKDSNSFYYKLRTCADEKRVRKATKDEIYWFNKGITNINNIPENKDLNYDIY